MLKHIVLATFLTCGAAAAYAQPQQAASPPASATAPAGTATAPMATADTRKLIGRNIQNAQNETIGEIKSIYIDKSGKVDSVIVGIGGFLGVGDREVRIAWSDLKISDNGEKVMVNMTKDDLKAKPEYKYGKEAWRGQVFSDAGPWTGRPGDARPADAPKATSDRLAETTKPADRTAPPADRTADRPATDRNMAATTSTGDFNASGEMSGDAIIGASVRNENRETVGKIEDVYLDQNGAIKTVVVSVGGFLGVGSKHVAVKWSDLKFSREDKSIVITTNWTKDSLKAMPDYKHERQQPATKSGG